MFEVPHNFDDNFTYPPSCGNKLMKFHCKLFESIIHVWQFLSRFESAFSFGKQVPLCFAPLNLLKPKTYIMYHQL